MSNTVLIPADGQPITTVDELNDVLVQAAQQTSGNYEIDLAAGASIELTTELKAINLQSGVTLDIEGNGATLDGKNETTGVSDNQRGVFVYSGKVTIENLTIANTTATGGTGGGGAGGGAGLGGGLLVANDTANHAAPGDVTLSNVVFANDMAVGGYGGQGDVQTIGGGGGLGGNGNNGGYYGGGGGIGSGIVPGVASGAGNGNASGAGGDGGGIGGTAGSLDINGGFFHQALGGLGGFGGGGGAGDGIGGNGGFGGGGGADTGVGSSSSQGGYGGGGGANSYLEGSAPGAGGFGGGSGGQSAYFYLGGGGGGLGAGGDIFVMDGALLTISQGSLSGGQVFKGVGGSIPAGGHVYDLPGTDGQAYGGGIFLQGNENINFAPVQGTTVTIADVIADEFGSGGGGVGYTGKGALTLNGAGALELGAVNSFSGGVTIDSGTLEIGADGSAGSGAITFSSASAKLQLDATLAGGSSTVFADTLSHVGPGYELDLQGLAFVAGATATVVGTTLVVTSGTTSETFTLDDPAQAFRVASDGLPGTPGTLVTAFAVPTITGAIADQLVVANGVSSPFSDVTIGDLNSGATETLTITLSDPAAGTLAEGAGFAGTATLLNTAPGIYSLSGTPTALTAELQALAFHAGNGTPGSFETTTFTLNDQSNLGYTAGDSTTTVAVVASGNTVPGPGAGGTIDIGGLAYSAAVNTSFSSGGMLTVGNLSVNVSGVTGAVLLLGSDGHGGTLVTSYATLSDAIAAVDGKTSGHYTIQLTSDSVETADPAAIDLASGVGLTISGADGIGGSYALDGGAVAGVGGHRGLFVAAGAVTIEDLDIQHAAAVGATGGTGSDSQHGLYEGGGGGGGGGAGLGGGLFVASGASASLIDVGFAQDSATGGAGGQGGLGAQADGNRAGGTGGQFPASDGFGSGGSGGTGLSVVVRGATSGASGGFGGGGGGGGGGDIDGGVGPPGGSSSGGFGGGGGNGGVAVWSGGDGGMGGGGLGAGGDIFVQDGGTLIISGGSLVDGTVTAGTGANPGQNFGKGLFLQGTSTATFTAAGGDTTTVAFTITDQNGSVHTTVAGESGNVAIGDVAGTLTGTVDLTGTDTYTGATTLNAGTLLVDGAIAGSAVEVKSGATLGGHGTTGAVTVDSGGTFAPGDSPGQITVASLTLSSGAHFEEQIGGMTAGSGYDQTVAASGGTISLNGATLDVTDYNGFVPTLGILTIIDNQDPSAAVTGVFDDAQGHALAQGSVITVAGVDFRINYHGGDGNDVTLSDLNVAPTLAATATNPTFTGNVLTGAQGAAVTVFSSADAEVVDRGTSIIGLNLTVGGLHDGASETLIVDGSTIGLGGASSGTTSSHGLAYSVSFANGTATIAFTSSGTSAATIDSIIDGIAYQDTNASDPTAGDRTVTLTQIQNSGGTTDGGVDTATVSIASTVHVDVINNQPPTLTATADNPNFIESAQLNTQVAPVTVFSGANASAVESGQSITGLNLAVAGLQDGADETVIVDGTTIALGGASSGTTGAHGLAYSVSLSGGTATISFSSGGISAAEADGIIDGIAYQNINQNDPTAGGRTITLTVLDSGGTVDGGVDISAPPISSTVTVVPVNYAPSLTATATDSVLHTAAPIQPIATPFAGADAGSVKPGESFSGFSFTVQGLLDGANETVNVDGTAIALGSDSNGTTAGNGLTYAVSLANGTATVTLTSSGVSSATIDGIIDGLTYADTLVNATAGDRTITLTRIQESGGTAHGGVDTSAVSIAATVELTEVNNAPTATAAGQVVYGSQTIPINTATAGNQDDPQIAALKDGGYVVAWQDGDPSGYFYAGSLGVGGATGDSSGSAIKARVFTADGAPEGSEILVNTTTPGNQAAPAITTLADGDFVITWTNAGNIDGQLFSAAGAKEGAEFQVNTSGSGFQPSIAALSGGGFAVVWGSYGSGYFQVEAQTFAADGTETGSQIPIGNYVSTSGQAPAAITPLSGGGFAVSWIDLNYNVEAQVFSATGTPVGAPAVLGADYDLYTPAMAALNNGGFALTWANGNTIDAQVFSAAGAELGPLIHDQAQIGGKPEIATLANGDFVIAWTNTVYTQYYSLTYLMAQVFTPDGEAAIAPIAVSTAYDSGFGTPDVTALPNGQFVVTYAAPSYSSDQVVSSVYTATGAYVGGDGGAEVGAQGTPAVAIGNNGVAFAWSDWNGNDLDVSAGSFHVGYQEIAGRALNLKTAGLSVGDIDGLGGSETLTLSVTEGVLNVAAGGSGATVSGSGSGLVTIDGTIAEINALLNTDNASTISFTDANPDPARHVTLTMTMDDHGNSGTGGALTATSEATIEVASQLVNTVPRLALAQEGVATEIAGLSVVDRDAETVTTTLLTYSGGTLTVGAVDGAVVSGSGSQQVTISGTLAQVDAVLSAANNVLYQGNFFGVELVEMTSHANGSSAFGGPLYADTFFRIDVGVPGVLGVVASGVGITNGSGDVNASDIVTLTVQFTDAVYVDGGTPTLFLNDGGSATYSGGSGTDALTFTYQVMPGDNTAALSINGYDPAGASFLDAAGHDADINSIFSKLSGTVQVDTTAPTVSVAADPTALLARQASTVTFTFSEAISSFALGDVTVTGGTLGHLVHVGLDANHQDIYTATFTPDVANTLAGTIEVNDASYTDLAGNTGGPSNTLDFSGDTLAPNAPSVALAHDTGISGTDHLTNNPALVYTLSDHTDTLLYKADAATAFSTTAPTFATDGSHTVSVEEQDAAGNISPATSFNFTLDTIAPTLTGITASPGSGVVHTGSTVEFVFSFNEAVHLGGGTPTLSLDDGATAVYDAAATAALHDATKLAFDYLVSSNDSSKGSLAVTGFVANGATVADFAGNAANLNHATASFALQVNDTVIPAFQLGGGIVRPALELNPAGQIVLDQTSAAFADEYGTKFLYAGLPASTPVPPVDPHHDFHLSL